MQVLDYMKESFCTFAEVNFLIFIKINFPNYVILCLLLSSHISPISSSNTFRLLLDFYLAVFVFFCICILFFFHPLKVRQGLKTFSEWPTFPQIYVNGEFVGGLDIIKVCYYQYIFLYEPSFVSSLTVNFLSF